jgi:hypothetical protein
MRLPDRQIATVARQAGFTGPDLATAVAVCLAESGGNPDALSPPNRNGTRDHGLWQINSVHKGLLAQGNWRNPVDNARMAYSIYKGRGNTFKPWSAYNNGKHMLFMPRAKVAAKLPTDTPQPTGTVVTPAGLPGPVDEIAKGFAFFTDPGNWKRLGLFTIGGVMVLMVVVRETGAIAKVTSGVKMAATKGLVK